VVDFVRQWSNRTGIAVTRFINWLEISSSKYYNWQTRYGQVNEHNGLIPRDFWLDDWEKQAIIRFCLEHPLEGYRRLTFMMLDRDIVAVSPSHISFSSALNSASIPSRLTRSGLVMSIDAPCILDIGLLVALLPIQFS
jgi:hypothetical protein